MNRSSDLPEIQNWAMSPGRPVKAVETLAEVRNLGCVWRRKTKKKKQKKNSHGSDNRCCGRV